MAHMWVEKSSGDPAWVAQSLDGEAAVPLAAHRTAAGEPLPQHAAALLLCSRSAEGESWLIMNTIPSGVVLNGTPLRSGIRLLADRDEIHIAGAGRVYFSVERLACVVAFPGADTRVDCVRCKQEIVRGTPAVRCPACGRWFHQSDDLPCWTYSDRCLCPQPTALDAGYQWTPHGL